MVRWWFFSADEHTRNVFPFRFRFCTYCANICHIMIFCDDVVVVVVAGWLCFLLSSSSFCEIVPFSSSWLRDYVFAHSLHSNITIVVKTRTFFVVFLRKFSLESSFGSSSHSQLLFAYSIRRTRFFFQSSCMNIHIPISYIVWFCSKFIRL